MLNIMKRILLIFCFFFHSSYSFGRDLIGLSCESEQIQYFNKKIEAYNLAEQINKVRVAMDNLRAQLESMANLEEKIVDLDFLENIFGKWGAKARDFIDQYLSHIPSSPLSLGKQMAEKGPILGDISSLTFRLHRLLNGLEDTNLPKEKISFLKAEIDSLVDENNRLRPGIFQQSVSSNNLQSEINKLRTEFFSFLINVCLAIAERGHQLTELERNLWDELMAFEANRSRLDDEYNHLRGEYNELEGKHEIDYIVNEELILKLQEILSFEKQISNFQTEIGRSLFN